MADQFISEIRIVGFNFAPTGWAFCNGQLLPISQNTALFSLLGTTYGGNGKSTFALPNLQGLAPLGNGNGPGLSPRSLGETGGTATVTLLAAELPAHNHPIVVSSSGGSADPTGKLFGVPSASRGLKAYDPGLTNQVKMAANALEPTGALPHNNLQPYLVLNYVIALQGIFPPRS